MRFYRAIFVINFLIHLFVSPCQLQARLPRESDSVSGQARLPSQESESGRQVEEEPSMEKPPAFSNRLSKEKSPYLLQHADNPVDWFPWTEEAFSRAKQEDKPVFLSIGYSTCHWCHVMEHESFENVEVASVINKYFIPIKVDREERPDIDNIYMTAVQAMAGQGGWPLTVFLTPEKKPFYGGTYFPPYAKWGSPGLVDLLRSIKEAWKTKRDEINASSHQLTDFMKRRLGSSQESGKVTEDILTTSFQQFSRSFDEQFAGFGQAPKFPSSHNLSFLLRYWKRYGEAKALRMGKETLQAMARGGMYDHLGGGFHRYATDREWQIPHFEKMLYDQAMLSRTYLEAFQITKDPFYERIAREIFEYVLRDLHHPEGGFYSAEDADSLDPQDTQHAKKEGAFYLWTYEAVKNILEKEELEAVSLIYDIKPEGNAYSDPHGEFVGKNIIYEKHRLGEASQELKRTEKELEAVLKGAKQKLFQARLPRPRPHLDDKILTDWNGLMLASFAYGYQVLRDPAYREAAVKAADFIIQHLIDKNGRLLHRYRDGEAAIPGMLEDYAFFIHGLIELYQATFETKYLALAFTLSKEMLRLFWDETDIGGGFHLTAKDAEELLFRPKEIYDGAIPSGNSMAALVMIRLYHLSLEDIWSVKCEAIFSAFASDISQAPSAYSQMLSAFDYFLGPSQEMVIAGEKDDRAAHKMIEMTLGVFLPNKVVILRPEDELRELVTLMPFLKNQKALGGVTTVYVCENAICKLPLTDLEKYQKLLVDLTTQHEPKP